MSTTDDITTKTDDQIKEGYEVLMAQLIGVWVTIPQTRTPSKQEEKVIEDLENKIDIYIKEINKRGLSMPGWGAK